MIVRRLERMVTDAAAHEEATHALERTIRGVMLARYGSGPRMAETIEQRTEEALCFIRAYVASAAAVVADIHATARDEGAIDDLLPVLVAAEDYFMRAVDLIPDHLGLAGVTDDAYMVQSLLQHVSEAHARRTGEPLFSIDLAAANALMRRMIGEPIATSMDATVREVFGLRDVQIAREALERRRTRLRLKLTEPCGGTIPTGDDLDLNLGALAGRG